MGYNRAGGALGRTADVGYIDWGSECLFSAAVPLCPHPVTMATKSAKRNLIAVFIVQSLLIYSAGHNA